MIHTSVGLLAIRSSDFCFIVDWVVNNVAVLSSSQLQHGNP